MKRDRKIDQIATNQFGEIFVLSEGSIFTMNEKSDWVELPALPQVEIGAIKPTPHPSTGQQLRDVAAG